MFGSGYPNGEAFLFLEGSGENANREMEQFKHIVTLLEATGFSWIFRIVLQDDLQDDALEEKT